MLKNHEITGGLGAALLSKPWHAHHWAETFTFSTFTDLRVHKVEAHWCTEHNVSFTCISNRHRSLKLNSPHCQHSQSLICQKGSSPLSTFTDLLDWKFLLFNKIHISALKTDIFSTFTDLKCLRYFLYYKSPICHEADLYSSFTDLKCLKFFLSNISPICHKGRSLFTIHRSEKICQLWSLHPDANTNIRSDTHQGWCL